MDKSTVRELLSKFHFPDICKELSVRNGGTSLVLDYMDDRPDELLDWDVCVPESNSGDEDFNSLETHTLKLSEKNEWKNSNSLEESIELPVSPIVSQIGEILHLG